MNERKHLICYLLFLFISATSLFYSAMVREENIKIREAVNNNREIPISVKQDLGLR